MPDRVVAIGDLHGDLDATRRALKLAGAIDDKDAWIGGKLVVVQTGDEIDRGDDDRKILDLIEKLKGDAKAAGGDIIAMCGNHEIMNAEGDFRYVTPGGFNAFQDVASKADTPVSSDPKERGRRAAFAPGGVYAKMLSSRPVVARVGDTIFVHGGVEPKFAKANLDVVNTQAKEWLNGERNKPPAAVGAEDGPLWSRRFSQQTGPDDCAVLDESLKVLNAKRMVMGHTPQKPDVSPACDGKAWRIDTGMSKFYSGNIEVLELKGDTATVLKEH